MTSKKLGALLAAAVAMGAPAAVTAENAAEAAAAEYKRVLALTPNLENGKRVYQICMVCHGPEGWGTEDGYYPQIAGQLSTVLIKQLADIRSRNRDNPTMYPFTIPSMLGGEQDIADVAAYVASLPMDPRNSVGPGFHVDYGEQVYKDNCVECHGKQGEGDPKEHIPLIRGQHYRYLLRQFEWIANGRRRNADSKMVKQIKRFTSREIWAVMDYVSRLGPPDEKRAEPGWQNPDFPKFVRPMPPPVPDPPKI